MVFTHACYVDTVKNGRADSGALIDVLYDGTYLNVPPRRKYNLPDPTVIFEAQNARVWVCDGCRGDGKDNERLRIEQWHCGMTATARRAAVVRINSDVDVRTEAPWTLAQLRTRLLDAAKRVS